MKHFIATDWTETAIYGVGTTRSEAVEDAVTQSQRRATVTDFIIYPASQQLIEEVEKKGGAHVAWDYDANGLAVLSP